MIKHILITVVLAMLLLCLMFFFLPAAAVSELHLSPLWSAALLSGRQTVVFPLPNSTAIQGIFLPMQGVNVHSNQPTLNQLRWIRVR